MNLITFVDLLLCGMLKYMRSDRKNKRKKKKIILHTSGFCTGSRSQTCSRNKYRTSQKKVSDSWINLGNTEERSPGDAATKIDVKTDVIGQGHFSSFFF